MKTIRKYGKVPFVVGLIHGGPGAQGEMQAVAQRLAGDFGVLEFLQTARSVQGQIEELHAQISQSVQYPIVLAGYSWGAWLGFLFTARYPSLVKKLILISSPSFSKQYVNDLMPVRLNRLSTVKKEEAEKLFVFINSGQADSKQLERFGELMSMADTFDYDSCFKEEVKTNKEIFHSVWSEAAKLRETDKLLLYAGKITCPVTAIHGLYDPHPVEGIEEPLTENLCCFKMIKMDKCGHSPWKERQAKDNFYKILIDEIS